MLLSLEVINSPIGDLIEIEGKAVVLLQDGLALLDNDIDGKVEVPKNPHPKVLHDLLAPAYFSDRKLATASKVL